MSLFLKEISIYDLKQLSDIFCSKPIDKNFEYALKAYEKIREFFNNSLDISEYEFFIGVNFAYSWMPTMLEYKKDNLNKVIKILKILKTDSNIYLTFDAYKEITYLVNNSVIGTSKLLHFITPERYPIWDSRIYKRLYVTSSNSGANDIKKYFEYLKYSNELQEYYQCEVREITRNVSIKIGYNVTFYRALDLILYI